jgi:secreted trypsin-like serine protease
MEIVRSCGIFFTLLLSGAYNPALAIANGEQVTDDEFAADFPWTVAVVSKKDGGVCGGILISPRMVVTAAHCTGMKKYVLVGNAERSAARRVAIEKPMRHPDFDPSTLQNDVGLLYLAEPVLSDYALLATDAEYQALLRPGARATILGWGKPASRTPAVDRIQKAETELLGLRTRGSQYMYTDPQTGPCGYDSGGPMLMVNQFGQHVVVGVASATDGNLCARGGGTAIYTRLDTVRDFIDAQLRRFANK